MYLETDLSEHSTRVWIPFEGPIEGLTLYLRNGRIFKSEFSERPPAQVDRDLAFELILESIKYGHQFPHEDFLELQGTEFQKKVWMQILQIPFGQTRTYSELADSVGCPRGQRAVAAACGANPVPLIVPCHRVVGRTHLGGFSADGGTIRKAQLLSYEQAFANRQYYLI